MTLRLLTVILMMITFKAFGQCTAMYHFKNVVTEKGDTVNREDSLGYYQGLHIYADNEEYKLNNTTTYTMGYYENGKPIGLWTNHCKDGTYSIGQYEAGIQVTSDGQGGWTEKNQGIYQKVGEWKYYTEDSSLIKIETYDRFHNRKGWTNKTYLTLENGIKALIEYDFNSRHNLESPFKKQVNKLYRKDGTIIKKSFENFFVDISIEYHPNGQAKRIFKCRKFLGIKINKSITKTFSEDGKLIDKTKGKCWTTIIHPAW